jgi:hypothetical protein
MKSNSNPDFSSKSSSSVPISVYKELAAELQATRAMVDSLNNRNQQLLQQNQTIRQEVDRVVQASFHLQQVAESTSGISQPNFQAESIKAAAWAHQEREAEAIANRLRTPDSLPPLYFTEEPARPRVKSHKPPKDLGNLGVFLTILLVVLTAFGLGFVAVKQLLPSR